jgi:hypothetical protein
MSAAEISEPFDQESPNSPVANPSVEAWYDQLQAFASYEQIDFDDTSFDSRTHIGKYIIDYLSAEVEFQYPQRPHIPHNIVSHRYSKYITQFAAQLNPEHRPDRVQTLFFNNFRTRALAYTAKYAARFPEVQKARQLYSYAQGARKENVAKSSEDTLVAYGVSLQTLETIRNNIRHVIPGRG